MRCGLYWFTGWLWSWFCALRFGNANGCRFLEIGRLNSSRERTKDETGIPHGVVGNFVNMYLVICSVEGWILDVVPEKKRWGSLNSFLRAKTLKIFFSKWAKWTKKNQLNLFSNNLIRNSHLLTHLPLTSPTFPYPDKTAPINQKVDQFKHYKNAANHQSAQSPHPSVPAHSRYPFQT